MSRQEIKYYTWAQRSTMKREAPKLYKALSLIQRHGPLGQNLFDWLEKCEIKFAEKQMSSVGLYMRDQLYGGLGLPSGHRNTIFIHPQNHYLLNISVLSHEIMHAIQDISTNTSAMGTQHNSDVLTRVLGVRAKEAAAETFAIWTCFAMKINGYGEAFEYNQTYKKGYSDLHSIFKMAYNSSLNGSSHQSAMRAACNKTFQAYWTDQKIADAYNSMVLAKFIEDASKQKNNNLELRSHGNLEEIEKAGKINDRIRMITDLKLDVSDRGLFGQNDFMRQAFDYVHLIHEINLTSENSFSTLRHKFELWQDNNPFIGTNIFEALKIYKQHSSETHAPCMLKIMKELAGIPHEEQLGFDFNQALGSNIKDDSIVTKTAKKNILQS